MYMCFPCYREFNTLEEVLEHQLTCAAEDEQPDTSGTVPVTVPVLQTRVNIVLSPFYHAVMPGCCELEMELKNVNTVIVQPDMTDGVIT